METNDGFEVIEQDWEACEYCDCSYYEYDTGYREYECRLWMKQDEKFYNCCGGDISNGCPLSFKYKVKKDGD